MHTHSLYALMHQTPHIKLDSVPLLNEFYANDSMLAFEYRVCSSFPLCTCALITEVYIMGVSLASVLACWDIYDELYRKV